MLFHNVLAEAEGGLAIFSGRCGFHVGLVLEPGDAVWWPLDLVGCVDSRILRGFVVWFASGSHGSWGSLP